MKQIQMVDVQTQYRKLKSKIDAAVIGCIESGAFIGGARVQSFQANLERYLQAAHVIPCANGTDALQIALMALGLRPGDEVIVPTFTYVATAEVIGLLGLTPVLVDVDADTFNVRAQDIEKSITAKTRAIVPVHLFGQSADMEAILALAATHNLHVVEDNAQAIGAIYTFSDGRTARTGTMGAVGCTSFYPSKNLGAFGDGGAMCTNDSQLAERLRVIANHGQRKRYYHDEIGVNSRLDAIQAAILDIKLQHLDAYAAARQEAAAFYDRAFAQCGDIQIPVRDPRSTHVFHQYTLRVPAHRRDALQAYLQQHGIPSMIYYPVPLYAQAAFAPIVRCYESAFPNTERLCAEVISLPMHTELEAEQLEHIAQHVLGFFSA